MHLISSTVISTVQRMCSRSLWVRTENSISITRRVHTCWVISLYPLRPLTDRLRSTAIPSNVRWAFLPFIPCFTCWATITSRASSRKGSCVRRRRLSLQASASPVTRPSLSRSTPTRIDHCLQVYNSIKNERNVRTHLCAAFYVTVYAKRKERHNGRSKKRIRYDNRAS